MRKRTDYPLIPQPMEALLTPYCSFGHDVEKFEEREIRGKSPTDSVSELTRNAVCGMIVFRDEKDEPRYVGVFEKPTK